ncbi:phage terminase large subunit family protein, partial [Viridibacillus arvi]|uniref:phage terminase large subunit family protein n=1 Tax=Viridibacillus arvi TaxID=263475 RepID=UPI0034D013FF
MVKQKTIKLFSKIVKLLAPPPELTISEWADENRFLSAESSAERGKWNTDRAPYQRGIMDAITDPKVEEVVVMASAQVGKSEIINNTIGYYVAHDPWPIMLVQPTLDMAEAYSKDRLAPMIRDTPVLRKIIDNDGSRKSNNTLLRKEFPGGHLSLVGANSAASLASRPVRIVLADEVDRFPTSAGNEGDPLTLAQKRTKNFWNRKKLSVSTPTIANSSRIEDEYKDSSQHRWHVSCPCCGYFQPYVWERIKHEAVGMECESCKEVSTEAEWKKRPGEWIAKYPENMKRGFHINALASPWETWDNIINEYKKAKKAGTERYKTWINTTLGEAYEEDKSEHKQEELLNRRFEYKCDVPEGVLLLTAGVDVQDDRLEVEVTGWGLNETSWGINYQVFRGDLTQPAIWNQLDKYLEKQFFNANGEGQSITATCMDSGGHFTDEVYKFCKERKHRRIYAIKGVGREGTAYINSPKKVGRKKDTDLYSIGVNYGKDLIY